MTCNDNQHQLPRRRRPQMNAWGRTDAAGTSRARIRAIRTGVVAVLALGATLAIAACGGGGGIEGSGGSNASVQTVQVAGEPSDELEKSKWLPYIDKQAVHDLANATGVQVKYSEHVLDN